MKTSWAKLKLKMELKLGVEVLDEVGVQLLYRVGGEWSDKTKVILNSTQFKFKLKLKSKLELSLAIKLKLSFN